MPDHPCDFYQDKLKRFSKLKENGCWIWSRSKTKKGYGMISYKGKAKKAHRLSYVVFNNVTHESIKHLCVCHKCDTPSCVNPDHLFLGTNLDNQIDSKLKKRNRPPKPIFGTQHHNAKLSDDIVIYIRKNYKPYHKEFSLVALAKKFGVRANMIDRVVRREAWSHVK